MLNHDWFKNPSHSFVDGQFQMDGSCCLLLKEVCVCYYSLMSKCFFFCVLLACLEV